MEYVNGEINKTGFIDVTGNPTALFSVLTKNGMTRPNHRAQGVVTFVDGPQIKTAEVRLFAVGKIGPDNTSRIFANTSNADLARVLGVGTGRFVLATNEMDGWNAVGPALVSNAIESLAVLGRTQEAPAGSIWTWETVLVPWMRPVSA